MKTHHYHIISYDFDVRSSKVFECYNPRQASTVQKVPCVGKEM